MIKSYLKTRKGNISESINEKPVKLVVSRGDREQIKRDSSSYEHYYVKKPVSDEGQNHLIEFLAEYDSSKRQDFKHLNLHV
jgi:hypothetical protein